MSPTYQNKSIQAKCALKSSYICIHMCFFLIKCTNDAISVWYLFVESAVGVRACILQVRLKNSTYTRGMSCISGEGVIYLHSAMTRHRSHSVAHAYSLYAASVLNCLWTACCLSYIQCVVMRCEWHWVSLALYAEIGLLRYLFAVLWVLHNYEDQPQNCINNKH